MLPDLALTDNVQTDEERHHGPDHGGDADDEDSLAGAKSTSTTDTRRYLGEGPVQSPVDVHDGGEVDLRGVVDNVGGGVHLCVVMSVGDHELTVDRTFTAVCSQSAVFTPPSSSTSAWLT